MLRSRTSSGVRDPSCMGSGGGSAGLDADFGRTGFRVFFAGVAEWVFVRLLFFVPLLFSGTGGSSSRFAICDLRFALCALRFALCAFQREIRNSERMSDSLAEEMLGLSDLQLLLNAEPSSKRSLKGCGYQELLVFCYQPGTRNPEPYSTPFPFSSRARSGFRRIFPGSESGAKPAESRSAVPRSECPRAWRVSRKSSSGSGPRLRS